jgi:hypothetical protein
MMDVKQAVGIAVKFVKEVYNENDILGLLLEEVMFNLEDDIWYVTLGFDRPERTSAIDALSGRRPPRAYKIIAVSAKTGEIQSMKIRE